MRLMLRSLLVAALFAIGSRAEAQVVRINVAADGWFGYCYYPYNYCYYGPGGPVGATFSLDAQIGYRFALQPTFEAGGRVGFAFLLLNPGYGFGVPLDLYARLTVGHRMRVYFEGAGGPWFAFAPNYLPILMGHGTFGAGITSGRVSFGLEIGWLFNTLIAGIRFGGTI